MYNFVYQSDATAVAHNATGLTTQSVSITGTTLTTSTTTSIPALASTSNASTQQVGVTSVLRRTTNIYPTDSVSYSFTAKHPLKPTVTSTLQTRSGLLLYTDFGSSTSENEDFKSENFRIQKASYDTLPFASIDTNAWDSSVALTNTGNAGHHNGLALWKNVLVHGKQVGDMSSFGPSGNVNYSAMSGVGTFYRKFKMTSNASMPYVIMDLIGSSSTTSFLTTALAFPSNGTGANNELTPTGSQVAVSMMIVKANGTKVGFFNPLTYSGSFGYNGRRYNGTAIVGGGAGISNSNTGLVIDFLAGYTISKDDYIIIKVQANDTWAGNISNIKVRYA
jgi:hypothetical protein